MIPANEHRPPNFTGLHGDRHYYRGRRWFGATNRVGAGGRNRNMPRGRMPGHGGQGGSGFAPNNGAHIDVFDGAVIAGEPNVPRDRATPHVRQPNRRELRRARARARAEEYTKLTHAEREARAVEHLSAYIQE